MPDATHIQLPMQCREAAISAIHAESRTVNLVWSTGARVKRRRWLDWDRSEDYYEELSLDPAHVRMERLRNGAPLLNAHSRYSLEDVLGVVEQADLAREGATARVRFSERETVDPVFRDVMGRIIRNVSVGYVTHKIEKLPPDARSEGLPIHRAIDWEPMELSLVPIGADAGAGTRSEEQQRTFSCEILLRGNDAMPNENHDAALETAKPTKAEIARIRTIRELVTRTGLPATLADEIIEGGASVAEARALVIARLADKTESTEIRSGFAGLGDMQTPATRVMAMGEALAHRFGGLRNELSEPAREFAYMKTHEMLRSQLEMLGIRASRMSASQIVSRYFELLNRAPSHSAGDFPNLFGDVAQRTLRQGYMSYAGGLKRISRKTTAVDFRTKHRIMFGEAPSLQKVLPGAEITQGSIAESAETYALSTYARIFGINRHAVVNDDLGALTDMASKWGRAAAEREASCFIDLFSANAAAGPTMSDGNPLFGTAHNNYSTGAATGTIDVSSVGAGVAKLRLQKGLDGTTPIDAEPRYLVVPAAKETPARQFVATITPAQISNANPYSNLEVVVDPRLDAVGTAGWYLASDPATIDTLEHCYLEGEEGVYLETRMGFEIDGLEFKARLDFACGALDHRGLFKASGS